VKRVVVRIDRLLLHGIGSGERRALAAGLRQELGLLLAQPGVLRALASLGHVADLRAGRLTAAATRKPRDTGAAVARAITRSIHR